MGDEPVGRPNTKGFSGVGAKSLILSFQCEQVHALRTKGYGPPANVICDVFTNGRRAITDNETWIQRVVSETQCNGSDS